MGHFPRCHYFGRGPGRNGRYHRYLIEEQSPEIGGLIESAKIPPPWHEPRRPGRSTHREEYIGTPLRLVGLGAWVRHGASRMRTISLSPLRQGRDATGQLNVSLAASTAASETFNDKDTEPSSAMKSTAWPAIPVWGERATFTVPVAPEPGSHAIRSMVVVAPLAPANNAGFRTPFAPSAATALPTVTGSKNASCSTPLGAVAVTVHS